MARRSRDGWTHAEGLPLALCRLAPLAAIFHPAVRSSGPSGAGSRDFGRPLPSGLRVETFLSIPPYTVFDAWFHWTD
ncbi:hypothetical protein AB0K18_03860 [Nonomuraea sp. NPDC049421]|uniref:hypothetical protein n=1 Tax=Nonomuraea sp. NPDC049421 TaxID=3155275 RepID=UPI003439152B